MEFIDLKKQFKFMEDSIRARIDTVLKHGNYIMGQEIKELETKLAHYTGTKYCISCSSGTDALLLPLMAMGIGHGDAVLTTPFTFIATAEVIALLGAVPVFVDSDPATFNMSPESLRETLRNFDQHIPPLVNKKDRIIPKCILAVDIFGLPAQYDELNGIADEYGLKIIEDAAQSFGGIYKGKKAGGLANVGATSFFPAKPLGCYGDGGAIFTNDEKMAEVMCSIRVHGQGQHKYDNVRIGCNARLDTLQAAILLAKLEFFDKEIEMRQNVAGRYSEMLKEVGQLQYIPGSSRSAWAQYSIVSDKREQLMSKLKNAGIPTAVYYPNPLHLQSAFSFLGYKQGSMPVAESLSQRIFSIPMHPYLNEEDQMRIIDVLRS